MRRTPAITVLITVLLCLPMVTFTGTILPTVDDTPSTGTVLSQDPGTRLDPEDHTDHVPILIDEDTDFVSQGWPGSGTAGDPYIISGLNITYAVSTSMIRVHNTDKHFVIRDCFINQLSIGNALEFVNTSHATVEYTTVLSVYNTLSLNNANGTSITHSDFLAQEYPILMTYSKSCSISNNLLNSTSYRAILGQWCDQISLSSNIIQSFTGWYSVKLENCYNASSFNDIIYGGFATFKLDDCHSFSATGVYSEEAYFGIDAFNCSDMVIEDCTILSGTDATVDLEWCNSATITGCSFSSLDAYIMGLSQCNNSIIKDNFLNSTPSYGLHMLSCYGGLVDNNEVSNIGQDGIVVESSEDITVSNSTLSMVTSSGIKSNFSENIDVLDNFGTDLGYGIDIYQTHNGAVSGSNFSSVFRGILLDESENWTISYNTVADAYYGIDGQNLDNVVLTNNGIHNVHTGVYLSQTTLDTNVIDSVISNAENGIDIDNSHRIGLYGNNLSYCNYGIYPNNADNLTIVSNKIEHTGQISMYLYSMDNPVVTDNQIFNSTYIGLLIRFVLNGTFHDNIMVECGMLFDTSQTMNYLNQSMSGNMINGKPLYYGINLSGVTLDVDDFGQFILVNCSSFDVGSGIFNDTTLAFQIHSCSWVDIHDFVSLDNGVPVVVEFSDNCTVSDAIIDGAGNYKAIFVQDGGDITIDNVTIRDIHGFSGTAIHILSTIRGEITDCYIDSCDKGIITENFDNATISGCEIRNIDNYGIYISGSDYNIIQHNTIVNTTNYGLWNYGSDSSVFTNNSARYTQYGFLVMDAIECNATLNTFEDNLRGVLLDNADNWFVQNNTIRWNEEYGLRILGASSNVMVSYNIFLLNGDNGEDLGTRFWDDNVATGNWWGDYSGTGVYNIPGGGGSTDRYPMQYTVDKPIVNQPMDVWYAEGSEGNEIVWLPFDDSLKEWKVYIDGSLWAEDIWNFVDVTVNIDGLAYGTHTVEVIIWDVDQNNVTDTVIVTVYDDTPPEIDNPPNMDAFVDASGQEITWEVEDLNPDTYIVYDNGEEYATGSWTTGNLALDIDGLDEGLHKIVIVIYDVDGNSAKDTVLVQVIDDDTDPSINSPSDLVYTYGTTGNQITWDASDDWPASYEIEENNTLFVSGDWGGSRIVLDVDGLLPGLYEFTITVSDRSGNTATDAVNVTVIGLVPTTPTQPVDYGMLLIIGAIAGGIIVVITAALYIRKRRSA